MKKLILALPLALLAFPSYAADPLSVTLGANIPQSCGLLGQGGTPADKRLINTVNFDLTTAALGENVDGTRGNNAASRFINLSAFCNSASGAKLEWTIKPLLRTDAVGDKSADVIDFKVHLTLREVSAALYGTAFARLSQNTGYGTADGLLADLTRDGSYDTYNKAFSTSGNVTFQSRGVQLADGSYTKHAGPYTGQYTLSLVANGP